MCFSPRMLNNSQETKSWVSEWMEQFGKRRNLETISYICRCGIEWIGLSSKSDKNVCCRDVAHLQSTCVWINAYVCVSVFLCVSVYMLQMHIGIQPLLHPDTYWQQTEHTDTRTNKIKTYSILVGWNQCENVSDANELSFDQVVLVTHRYARYSRFQFGIALANVWLRVKEEWTVVTV